VSITIRKTGVLSNFAGGGGHETRIIERKISAKKALLIL